MRLILVLLLLVPVACGRGSGSTADLAAPTDSTQASETRDQTGRQELPIDLQDLMADQAGPEDSGFRDSLSVDAADSAAADTIPEPELVPEPCGNGFCGLEEDHLTCPSDCPPCDPDRCNQDLETCEVGLGGCLARTVNIPAGVFWMGCNQGEGSNVQDPDCEAHELPYHPVYLDQFSIDLTEVTVGQYKTCVDKGACTPPLQDWAGCTWAQKKYSNPMTCISWDQARAYCLWAGRELCSEARWEKAARGGCELYEAQGLDCRADSRRFPWGNDWPEACDEDSPVVSFDCRCANGNACPVGSRPQGASLYGVHDLGGNVWEWVLDNFNPAIYCQEDLDSYVPCPEGATWPTFPDPWENPPVFESEGVSRTHRGGSFFSSDTRGMYRVSFRTSDPPDSSDYYLGFRCCSPGM